MTNAEIAKRQAGIDARLAAATPGEWRVEDGGLVTSYGCELLEVDGFDTAGCSACFNQSQDAEFCANAKSDIEWQRERIKALEAEMDKAQKESLLAHQYSLETHKRMLVNRKWAQRWKRQAKKEREDRRDIYRLVGIDNA